MQPDPAASSSSSSCRRNPSSILSPFSFSSYKPRLAPKIHLPTRNSPLNSNMTSVSAIVDSFLVHHYRPNEAPLTLLRFTSGPRLHPKTRRPTRNQPLNSILASIPSIVASILWYSLSSVRDFTLLCDIVHAATCLVKSLVITICNPNADSWVLWCSSSNHRLG